MTRLPLWVKDDGTVYGLLTMMTRLVISSSLSLSLSLEGSIVYIYIYIYRGIYIRGCFVNRSRMLVGYRLCGTCRLEGYKNDGFVRGEEGGGGICFE